MTAERTTPDLSGGAPWGVQLTVEEVISAMDLVQHPEGGYFRETYRSHASVVTPYGPRAASTACMYLLTDKEPSRFHRIRFDEVWFYHSGALTELVLLQPAGESTHGAPGTAARLPEHRVIGPGSPYALVPGGWWVAARTIVGEHADWGGGRAPERRWTADRRASREFDWTLASCMVTPGFDFADFEMANSDSLLRDFPLAREVVLALT